MPSRIEMINGLASAVLLFGTLASLAEPATPSPLEQRGRVLAERMCAKCHAIGRQGKSPHAGAPLFRELGSRVDFDTFVDRLREGLVSDHPDMPTFHFDGENARAFRLYLRSIQVR